MARRTRPVLAVQRTASVDLQVFISRKLTSAPFREREEERSINGAGIFVLERSVLVFQVFSPFYEFALRGRRIDERATRVIYEANTEPTNVFSSAAVRFDILAITGRRLLSRLSKREQRSLICCPLRRNNLRTT